MAEKRMTCWQCPRYDRTARRCQDNKANPKTKSDSVAVAELLGVRALCHYNPYRDALAARRYFLQDLTLAYTPKPTRASRRPKIERPPEVSENHV